MTGALAGAGPVACLLFLVDDGGDDLSEDVDVGGIDDVELEGIVDVENEAYLLGEALGDEDAGDRVLEGQEGVGGGGLDGEVHDLADVSSMEM